MLETIPSRLKETHATQTACHCNRKAEIKVHGKTNFFSKLMSRIAAFIHSLEKAYGATYPLAKNKIKCLPPTCSLSNQSKVIDRIITPYLTDSVRIGTNSVCALGSTSTQFLGLLEKNLGVKGAAPWKALLNQFCRIHGSDKLQHIHQEQDGTYTIRLSDPLSIWMYSTDDKNRVDPLGGIVLMLGANQYQPLRREQLQGHQMKFQLLENEIRFLGGLEIFVKTPSWARPLTFYQMQEFDYTDVVSYKVNDERATITAQYEISIVTAHKAREKGLTHLTNTWGGESPTHPIIVLPTCSTDQIKATAQACIQKHLNDDFSKTTALRV